MIRRIKLLRNIGRFDSYNGAGLVDLKRLVLVYAENGMGKSTLSDILRSLATDDPSVIIGRQRFGSNQPPHIVLESDDNSIIMFKDGAWRQKPSNIKIFDDEFVDKNVYSGLSVEPDHRKNLHEFILGERGVTLNRRVQDLIQRNEKHNSVLRDKESALREHCPDGLSVDAFCDLPNLKDVDSKIENTERLIAATQKRSKLRDRTLFQPIKLPRFDTKKIQHILQVSLTDLDKDAEARVQAHISDLGEGGEQWLADGMRRISEGDKHDCPFCGRSMTGLDLIRHYGAYFSEGYSKLKREVDEMLNDARSAHGESARVRFELALQTVKEHRQFWSEFCKLPEIDEIDTSIVVKDWKLACDAVLEHLKAKQAAPLDQQQLDEPTSLAIDKYDQHREMIESINAILMKSNESIQEVKERVEESNPKEIDEEKSLLLATKTRYSQEVAPLCKDYLNEKRDKVRTEKERDKARDELKNYRSEIFSDQEDTLNQYLSKFNVGFEIRGVVPKNMRAGSYCEYNVRINEVSVSVNSQNASSGEPSFRNTLSAGDRNTLALAFFFSSLDHHPDLSNTIVVIDDPISSLDVHRSTTTVQTVRGYVERAGQLIVLSHNKRFLCDLWERANRNDMTSLKILQDGEGSAIRQWDVNQDLLDDHDKRHSMFVDCINGQFGRRREVAEAIRLHLERFIRVTCPADFQPGSSLGNWFIDRCRSKLGEPDEIMNEDSLQKLSEILEYAHKFHHDTNPDWEREHINDQELQGFVKRTLKFVRPLSR